MQSNHSPILNGVLRQDFFKLKSRLRSLTKVTDENKKKNIQESITAAIVKSQQLRDKKESNIPGPVAGRATQARAIKFPSK